MLLFEVPFFFHCNIEELATATNILGATQPPEVVLLLGENGYRHDTDVNPWENCIAPDIAFIFI